MSCGIYSITNKKTGQIYIGQSINIEKRWKQHIRGHHLETYIDNALQKYGKEAFNFNIIEVFDNNIPFLKDILNDSEQYYIAAYNTYKNPQHYNLTCGGENWFLGKKHSEATRKKMSQNMVGNKNHMFGKKISDEVKEKISKSNTKHYPRIVKNGKINNQQRYSLKIGKKIIYSSTSKDAIFQYILKHLNKREQELFKEHLNKIDNKIFEEYNE